ncbi:CHY zinc finger protein [Texcoconibacillus texcoconensis]|uniref:Putative CHY-type Zn-finger protein n=1 Tax=Texcoconibacillus texcoconensis TaxID=1095777 RepID=A0A840QSD5_9BACI|nr:CHY zinc finger protein [Texcoconibacillus texcoconensis]MBB5174187.1 putative CHY-type Zn-finger protein [Texcoconibacillus texcoconensis]
MNVHGIQVQGVKVDKNTRCQHYHTKRDVVAIKMNCCQTYYSCFQCHQEMTDHNIETWSKEQFDEKAILCGVCGTELTITQYMKAKDHCPHCFTAFNAGCRHHYHLYFQMVVF